jgi:uncharacterized protein YuzE
MKIKYDKETDILYIKLSDLTIDESDEDKKDIILDYAENGSIVGIEILNASKQHIEPTKIEYLVAA